MFRTVRRSSRADHGKLSSKLWSQVSQHGQILQRFLRIRVLYRNIVVVTRLVGNVIASVQPGIAAFEEKTLGESPGPVQPFHPLLDERFLAARRVGYHLTTYFLRRPVQYIRFVKRGARHCKTFKRIIRKFILYKFIEGIIEGHRTIGEILTAGGISLRRSYREMFVLLLATRHHLRNSRAAFRRCRRYDRANFRECRQHAFVDLRVTLIYTYRVSRFPVSLHFTLFLQTVRETVLSVHG